MQTGAGLAALALLLASPVLFGWPSFDAPAEAAEAAEVPRAHVVTCHRDRIQDYTVTLYNFTANEGMFSGNATPVPSNERWLHPRTYVMGWCAAVPK